MGTSDPTKWSHYLYDGEGNRIKKIVNTGTGKQTITVYIDGVYEHSYTKNNVTIDSTRHYNTLKIIDGSSLVATLHVGNDADDTINIAKKFYTADHLGNICVTYQETSTIINFEDFYPFGETAYGGYAKKRYRYNGKEKDADTGLYEYGQRYYAPWLCRFVSVDPIAEDFPFYSSYNYAGNKPESKVDLEGLQENGAESGPPSQKGNPNSSIKDAGNGYLLPEAEVVGVQPNIYNSPKEARVPVTPVTPALRIPPNYDKIQFDIKLPPEERPDIKPSQKPNKDSKSPLKYGIRFSIMSFLFIAGDESEEYKERQMKKSVEYEAEKFPIDELTGKRKNDPNIKWVTYTKFNPITGQTYSGRSSGSSSQTIAQIIRTRDLAHSKDPRMAGFLAAVPDQEGIGLEGYAEIRGREQQLIDYYGGAQTDKVNYPPTGGDSANRIRGVAINNKVGPLYDFFATKKFGRIARYTGRPFF